MFQIACVVGEICSSNQFCIIRIGLPLFCMEREVAIDGSRHIVDKPEANVNKAIGTLKSRLTIDSLVSGQDPFHQNLQME